MPHALEGSCGAGDGVVHVERDGVAKDEIERGVAGGADDHSRTMVAGLAGSGFEVDGGGEGGQEAERRRVKVNETDTSGAAYRVHSPVKLKDFGAAEGKADYGDSGFNGQVFRSPRRGGARLLRLT